VNGLTMRSCEPGRVSAIAASRSMVRLGTNDQEIFRTTEDVRAAFRRCVDIMTDILLAISSRIVTTRSAETRRSLFERKLL
jgi:hypothetical protein